MDQLRRHHCADPSVFLLRFYQITDFDHGIRYMIKVFRLGNVTAPVNKTAAEADQYHADRKSDPHMLCKCPAGSCRRNQPHRDQPEYSVIGLSVQPCCHKDLSAQRTQEKHNEDQRRIHQKVSYPLILFCNQQINKRRRCQQHQQL